MTGKWATGDTSVTLHGAEAVVKLTDPKPLPRDRRCPQCRAPESERQGVTRFGGKPSQACGRCGYEFPQEDNEP